jgi:hypothetical protein
MDPFAPLSTDPFASAETREFDNSGWWKPTTVGEYVIGRLDRIEASRRQDSGGKAFPDTAHFSAAIVYRGGDNRPLSAHKPLKLGLSSNLADRITSHDSGAYIRVTFTGYFKSAQPNPARQFDVRIIPRADAGANAKVAEKLTADYKRLESEGAPAADSDATELPF